MTSQVEHRGASAFGGGGEPEDSALLEAWGQGDAGAGDALIRRHFGAVFRYFDRRFPADVEDLTQRTFQALAESYHRFEGTSSLRAFILGIARHQAFAFARVKTRKHAPLVELRDSLAAGSSTPSARASSKETAKILARAVKQLPEPLQEVVELFYWEGFTSAEIHTALGVEVATVRTRLSRARQLLEEQLRTMDIGAAVRESTLTMVERWRSRPFV